MLLTYNNFSCQGSTKTSAGNDENKNYWSN